MLTASRFRCGERSRQCDREDGLEYGDEGSQGSYHTPKLGEENVVLVPVMEPILPPADQLLPPSDQENIPPRMVTPPPLNVLVEIPKKQELTVKECCRTTLAVCNQCAICSKGQIVKPFVVKPASSSHRSVRSSSTSKSCANSNDESDGSDEVLEATSPQVSRERKGSQTVMDLPRYHSLVEDFSRLADRWMAAGQLRGPAVMDMVIFRMIFFELFSFLHVHNLYHPFCLLTNLGKHQVKTNTEIRTADNNGTQK